MVLRPAWALKNTLYQKQQKSGQETCDSKISCGKREETATTPGSVVVAQEAKARRLQVGGQLGQHR